MNHEGAGDRYSLQIDGNIRAANVTADVLQNVGLCPKLKSPVHAEKGTAVFRDLSLINAGNAGGLNTRYDKHEKASDLIDWPSFLLPISSSNCKVISKKSSIQQTSGLSNLSKEGTVRARNRKCPRPKRNVSQCQRDKAAVTFASSFQSPELKRETTTSTYMKVSENRMHPHHNDSEYIGSITICSPSLTESNFSRKTTQHSFDSRGKVSGRYGIKDAENTAGVLNKIKEEEEEAWEINFSNNNANGQGTVSLNTNLSDTSQEYFKMFTSVKPDINATDYKFEKHALGDHNNPEKYHSYQPKPSCDKSDSEGLDKVRIGNVQSFSSSKRNLLCKVKLETEFFHAVKLPSSVDVSVSETQKGQVSANDGTKKEHGSPAVSHIKQENLPEYEVEHWCDLGPSSQYAGNDSFDTIDEKDDLHKSLMKDNETHSPEHDRKKSSTSWSVAGDSRQLLQSRWYSNSPHSAVPVSCATSEPILDSHSCFDRRTPYVDPLGHPPHLSDLLHPQQSSSLQHLTQSTPSLSLHNSTRVDDIQGDFYHANNISLSVMSSSQTPTFNFHNALYMLSNQTPPYGLYPYPYVSMMAGRSNWRLVEPQALNTHQNYISNFHLTDHLHTANQQTISPQGDNTTTSTPMKVATAPRSGPMISADPDNYNTDCFKDSNRKEESSSGATSKPMSIQREKDDVPLRDFGKQRPKKRNEDFVDPTEMKFGLDDDEESNDSDRMQIASDEEWMPEQVREKEGSNSDSELDDDDDRAQAQRLQTRSRQGIRKNLVSEKNLKRPGPFERPKESQCKEKKCPTCGKICKGNYQLRRHQLSHSEYRPYQCSQCDKGFKQKAHLKGHIKSVHSKSKHLKSAKTQNDNKNNANVNGETTLKVKHHKVKSKTECGKSESADGKHFDKNPIKPVVPEANEKEDILRNNLDQSRPMRPRAGRPRRALNNRDYTCRLCGKSFKTAYRLKRHEQSHTDVRPYACRTCGKRFKQSGHRNEHEANHQRQGVRFLCNKCGVVFRCRSSFNSHMRAHSQEQTRHEEMSEQLSKTDKSQAGGSSQVRQTWEMMSTVYDCPYCVEKFATAQALNSHLDTHVEIMHRRHVQPYSCDVCRRKFTYRHNLIKHSLMHKAPEKFADFFKEKMEAHVASGKPSYKCSHCSKVFIRKETLAKHAKIHTGLKPFKCPTCSQSFTQNIHLKVHMRKHTGIRPFQCQECGKGFIDSTALAKHIEYEACNSENFVYRCKICDKRHNYLGSIKQHMRKDHNIEAIDVDSHIDKTQRVVKDKKADCDKAENGGKDKRKDCVHKEHKSDKNGRHQCLICLRTFKEKANLLRHVKRKHTQLLKILNRDSCEQTPSLSSTHQQMSPGLVKVAGHDGSFKKAPDGGLVHSAAASNVSSSSQSEAFNKTKTLGVANNDSSKTSTPKGDLVQTKDALELNTERPRYDQLCTGLVENNPVLTHTDGSFGADENVGDKTVVTFSNTELQYKTIAKDVGTENSPEQLESTNIGYQRHTSEEIEECTENTTDMLSPCENFLYKIGLTVSRKSRRPTKPPTSPDSPKKFDKLGRRDDGDALVEPATSFTDLTKDQDKHLGLGLKRTHDKKHDSSCGDAVVENISVVELDAKQLYCSGGFTGESFVVDLNDLDLSKTTYSRTPVGQGQPKIDNVVTTTRAFQAPIEEGNDNKDKDFHQVSDSTPSCVIQHLQSVEEYDVHSLSTGACSPVPLDLSQTHLRNITPQRRAPKCEGARSTYRSSCQNAKAKRFEANETGSTVTSPFDARPNRSKQTALDKNPNQIPPSSKKRISKESTASKTSLKNVFYVPYTSPLPITSEHVSPHYSTYFSPKPTKPILCNESIEPFDAGQDCEVGESPMDLSNTAQRSYTTVPPPTSYSATHFPASLGLTSLLTTRTGPMGTCSSSDYIMHQRDTPSYSSFSVPLSKSAANNFISEPHRNDYMVMAPTYYYQDFKDPWAYQNYRFYNNMEARLRNTPMSTLTLPPSEQRIPVPTQCMTSATVTATTGAQAAGSSPPSLPDSTMKTGNGFVCGKCGKIFNARHRLKRHELTHTDFRPYSCSQCGRAFRQKVHLSDHLKRHAGHRPFSCSGCGKRFILKNELNQHAKHYCCGKAGKEPPREAAVSIPADPHSFPAHGVTDVGSSYNQ
ncbi:zinc finger protein 184 [Elysia marginata]|uniref:Zinc finger protein 184 n=1 Tax=Elysia marginata TaxID=1093978 RepID=A0AAV4H4Q0_9GAST|nr:zinc finger protein 184 [Elysia marginata]